MAEISMTVRNWKNLDSFIHVLVRNNKQFLKGDQQPIIDYYLKVADESERLEPKLQDFHITTYKPFDMPSDEELDMINLFNRILNKK